MSCKSPVIVIESRGGDDSGSRSGRPGCAEGCVDRDARQALRRRGADRALAIGDRQDEARDCSVRAPSVASGCSISWNCSSRNWPRRRARMRPRPRPPAFRCKSFMRRPETRRNFPDHLPRRRIVHPAPASCPCCGGTKLSKIGEDVTETLDVVPRQWFVTEHVREKFSCRSCEKITQPPAPFHAISRGFAGPSLLAMILVDKYANHQPLNRQSEQLCARGHRALGIDHGRSCRRLHGRAVAALRIDQGSCVRRRRGSMATILPCRCWPR